MPGGDEAFRRSGVVRSTATQDIEIWLDVVDGVPGDAECQGAALFGCLRQESPARNLGEFGIGDAVHGFLRVMLWGGLARENGNCAVDSEIVVLQPRQAAVGDVAPPVIHDQRMAAICEFHQFGLGV